MRIVALGPHTQASYPLGLFLSHVFPCGERLNGLDSSLPPSFLPSLPLSLSFERVELKFEWVGITTQPAQDPHLSVFSYLLNVCVLYLLIHMLGTSRILWLLTSKRLSVS